MGPYWRMIFFTSRKASKAVMLLLMSVATISPLAYDSRSLQYNASSPRFACYTSKQQSVSLYQYTLPTAIWQAVQGMQSTTGISVYDVQGHKVATLRQSADLQRALPAGIYVIGGRKVLVR